jgi:hypothetical protein
MPPFEIANGTQLLSFALYCAGAGAVVFAIDLLACKIKSTESLLGIVYRKDNALFLFSLWAVGSGLMGLFGAYAEVFQLTKTSVISVGVAWPVLLSKIVKTNMGGAESEAVEREVDGEEDERP